MALETFSNYFTILDSPGAKEFDLLQRAKFVGGILLLCRLSNQKLASQSNETRKRVIAKNKQTNKNKECGGNPPPLGNLKNTCI